MRGITREIRLAFIYVIKIHERTLDEQTTSEFMFTQFDVYESFRHINLLRLIGSLNFITLNISNPRHASSFFPSGEGAGPI